MVGIGALLRHLSAAPAAADCAEEDTGQDAGHPETEHPADSGQEADDRDGQGHRGEDQALPRHRGQGGSNTAGIVGSVRPLT